MQTTNPAGSRHFNLPLRSSERRLLLLAVDLLLANVAVLLSLWLWTWRDPARQFSYEFVRSEAYWFVVLAGLWFIVVYVHELYDAHVAHSLGSSAAALTRGSLLLWLAYLVAYFFAPRQLLPRGVVLYFCVIAFVLVGLWRAAYVFLARAAFRIPTLVVGAGWAGRTIVQTIAESAGSEYELVGYVDDDPAKRGQVVEGLQVIGTSDELLALVRDRGIAQVILAITYELKGGLLARLLDCLELGAVVVPMPVVYERLTGRVPVEHVGDNWYVALPTEPPGIHGLYPFAKRLSDIVLAGAGLVFLCLALPFIAAAIYLDSPGPILYAQERVGKGGRLFRMYKFRSMIPDAEDNGAVWAQPNDARITTVGRLLRKTHVDEFPQFLNILRGEMSVVGPRPERPEFVEELQREIPFYRVRHAVRPGMGGWGLIRQGYAASREDALVRLQYDLYYVKHQSMLLDALILLRTIVDTLTLGGR
jgi:exopolysaccharide biosynthesis polyprenyl glycosylphosphotransferase